MVYTLHDGTIINEVGPIFVIRLRCISLMDALKVKNIKKCNIQLFKRTHLVLLYSIISWHIYFYDERGVKKFAERDIKIIFMFPCFYV